MIITDYENPQMTGQATFLCKLQFYANAWDGGMLPEASDSTICRRYISGQYIKQDQNAQWSSTKTSKCLWNLDESFYNASFSHNFAKHRTKCLIMLISM